MTFLQLKYTVDIEVVNFDSQITDVDLTTLSGTISSQLGKYHHSQACTTTIWNKIFTIRYVSSQLGTCLYNHSQVCTTIIGNNILTIRYVSSQVDMYHYSQVCTTIIWNNILFIKYVSSQSGMYHLNWEQYLNN